MREWRGVVVQLAAIFALVWLVKGCGDERVLFTAIGALGPYLGITSTRARMEAGSMPRSGGGGGMSMPVPPIVGALAGGVLSVIGVLIYLEVAR